MKNKYLPAFDGTKWKVVDVRKKCGIASCSHKDNAYLIADALNIANLLPGRLRSRPRIGTKVVVHGCGGKQIAGTKFPFRAKVVSYHECNDSCIRVKSDRGIEWIVGYNECSLK
jgi:hypothetical protein